MKPPSLQAGKRASDPEGLPVGSHRQSVFARALCWLDLLDWLVWTWFDFFSHPIQSSSIQAESNPEQPGPVQSSPIQSSTIQSNLGPSIMTVHGS